MDVAMLVLQTATVLGVAILAVFARRYVPAYFAEKARNLATKEDIEGITRQIEGVRSEYATQLEMVRTDLRLAAHRSETRFAHLHRLRVDAVVELYKKLVQTEELLRQLAGGFQFASELSQDEVAEKAAEAGNDLLSFYYERRLFFETDFITAFEDLKSTIMTAYATIVPERGEDQRAMDREERRETRRRLREAQAKLRNELPGLIAILEGQMRQLLEGESPDPEE